MHIPTVLVAGASISTLQSQLPIQRQSDQLKLHGRFLHLTDIHPDPFYRTNATVSSSCHSMKPKSESERAGIYGTPFRECDSPLALTNITLNWIENTWADRIDFVIWTGDSARHDNDRTTPRTPREIYEQNHDMAKKMQQVFGSRKIPVVPTIGNNDVWPHNIMTAGPNSATLEYSSIWKPFIPFPSYQIFLRGGYYSVEVIPGKLAVVALNTMYFYDSNKAVGGCEWVNRDTGGGGLFVDPGNLELDWLEVQLDAFRERGVKVWLAGHVPPSADNYYPECYWRYTELALRYQDTIVGHLFGHMNVDHFFFLEGDALVNPPTEGLITNKKKSTATVDQWLVKQFKGLKKLSKLNQDEYAVVHVAPSVVPNPYQPGVRVWSYNVTGVQDEVLEHNTAGKRIVKGRKPKKKRCKAKGEKNKWWCQIGGRDWFSDRNAPSRANRVLSPLGYVQWWLPGLDETAGEAPEWEIEYSTFEDETLAEGREAGEPVPVGEGGGGAEDGVERLGLVDGTVGAWLGLARRLGRSATAWAGYRELMFMGGPAG